MAAAPRRTGQGEHRIVFTPSGLSGTVAEGTSVLDAARELGVDLDSVCSGRAICGRCQVVPSVGTFPKWDMTVRPDHVVDPDDLEGHYVGRRPIADGHRLGCALRIVGDLVVDVPPASQIHKQIVRKDIGLGELRIDPVVTLRYVAFDDDDAGAGASVLDRIRAALARTWDLHDVQVDAEVLPHLHRAVADPTDGATLAVRDHRIAAAWPGYVDRSVGVAIDIGSTTVAGYLCDLSSGEVLATAGRMNPQIRFGEDLMSRVSYVMLNPGGDRTLTAAVRQALSELVTELAADAAVERSQVLELVLVGNPIMHHLVLGIDPTPLGQSPFTLATGEPVELRAADLDIPAPFGRVYLAPCIAGHVGADTAAAILAEGPHRGDAVQLLIDVGTNAEIVVGDRRALYAASSPTGPAFEGAQISCGQRATTGAVERVRIDRTTLEPRFRVIGCDRWSDEEGFTAAVADSGGVTGVCGSGIIEVIGELFLAGIIDQRGVIRAELAERTDRVVADGRTHSYVLYDEGPGAQLRITQDDVRAIQLAKAALRAGTDLLLEHAGLDRIDEVRLAGAFGAHIDPRYALVLGLVPDVPLDAVRSVGNAAGSGAVRALLSGDKRREMEATVRTITKIETATEPRFQELFVAALAFPHATAPSTHLAEVVDLPASRPASPPTGRRRRRLSPVAPNDDTADPRGTP
ncbi:ASKHA domain-containing protein [Nitriliruptor alkaliphilus]|uniref:ASKHA domain-containing protein n=1 Tax=Nitriliruptor alkaliphilus TaxID=427918 RepID=UPI000696980D|nr:ASKHA domain-containing protein [Nitriliruptor alkaliphilus]